MSVAKLQYKKSVKRECPKMEARGQMSKTTRITILENGKELFFSKVSFHEKGLGC
jgi:hypothetical protein